MRREANELTREIFIKGGITMANTIFTNVNVFDGTSPVLYPAEVLVQGNRIKEVARGEGKQLQRDGAEEIDCGGATLISSTRTAT